jgi:tetratricopeptide (TPR) repeat protein
MKTKVALAVIAALMVAALVVSTRTQPERTQPEPKSSVASASSPAMLPRPGLPAPRVQFTPDAVEGSADLPATNFWARLYRSQETIQLNLEQLETYLASNRRSAGCLLAAFRTTGDTNLLREAIEKFPLDPRVGFAAAVKLDASPEEHRAWLDLFKRAAPDNALADYLSAHEYLKAGQNDRALEELERAYGKKDFQDYSLEFMQDGEEAYRAAGYDEAEAKALAMTQLLLPHLKPLKDTGVNVIDLAKSYQQAGDPQSAQAALQIALKLGEQLQQHDAFHPLINELVGLAIERRVLETMNPTDPYGGQTVQSRLNEMVDYRKQINSLVQTSSPLIEALPGPEAAVYFDRLKAFGELPAMNWLINKYGPAN